MTGPRLVCCACEQVEVGTDDVVCAECSLQLVMAGILTSQSSTELETKPLREPQFNSLGIAKLWSVSVEVEGTPVLTISQDHYSGLPDLEKFEPTIRSAAQNLLGFVGKGDELST